MAWSSAVFTLTIESCERLMNDDLSGVHIEILEAVIKAGDVVSDVDVTGPAPERL